ncbi:hypothetical protein [Candidatus Contubernalis alkaliaceticus]|nr:hypothetical protein [Candidatus Contubernalis alkalaceticus]UNC92403.1 hypothetical protein HUE98_10010 [Candidatus Contubernalis alkalaceticus]
MKKVWLTLPGEVEALKMDGTLYINLLHYPEGEEPEVNIKDIGSVSISEL